MGVVLLLVKSVGGALVFAGLVAAGREGAKVLQQSPTPQASLTRTLVPVKASAGVQKTCETIHQTVHQVARAMAAGMKIADHIVRLAVPQLRHRLQHRFRPVALSAPRAERGHPLTELGAARGVVYLPHTVVQMTGLAAADVRVRLRCRSCKTLKKEADALTGTRLAEDIVEGACPIEGMLQRGEDLRIPMLIAAGSAVAVGCEPCLNIVVPALIEAGVGDSDIRMAVEIGQAVKDQASSIIQEAADVLAGTDLSSGARAIECEQCGEE